MKPTLMELKQQVCDANIALGRSGLVLGTFGNVSGIDRARGVVAIKPSGVPYEGMRPEQMVVVSLETGEAVEGNAGQRGQRGQLRPSSDLPTHLELYRAFDGIGGIVHTHSLHATAWAQAARDIPALGTTHADYFNGPIPCTRPLRPAEIRGDYERNTGLVIVERFARAASGSSRAVASASSRSRLEKSEALDPMNMPAVLVAGHGPFTWGPSADEAVHNAILLEYVASLAWMTRAINPAARPISDMLLEKHFSRKHGAGAYYGQRE